MTSGALARIPVTIVTGFLGSGKTSLINHLLSHGGLGRVAALVNDFGAIDIDAALVAEVADEVVQLSNGCICCTINGDLLAGVDRVLALDPPVDRIVVETTGLADPLPVGLTFLETELVSRCVLEAVVTVVDCANFPLDLFDADAAMAQIAHADIVVLNKIDLADGAAVADLEDRIGLIKPRARRLSALHGAVPVAAIVSAGDQASLAAPGAASRKHRHDHLFDDGFAAHAFSVRARMSSTALQSWLDEGLPAEVFRAKGIVQLDRPEQAYVFQLCGGRVSFYPYDGPIADTRLVFIGRGIDGASLEARARQCLVQPALAAAR
jgi:G3E family GTPase